MPTKAKCASRQRGTAHQRGYTSTWRRYSQQYRKANPLCVHCKANGKIKLAEHVDHIRPVNGPNDPAWWLESNHQGLCHACHSAKTKMEGGQWFG